MTEKTISKDELLGKKKTGFFTRTRVVVATIVAVAAIGGGMYFAKGGTAAANYATQDIATGNLMVTVIANGKLQPVRTVSVGSELSGIVDKVNVDVNSIVKEGDVLIELDEAKLRATVNKGRASLQSAKASLGEAKATLVEAKTKMKRYEELNRTSGGKLPSRLEMDTQRATVLKAEASVVSAEAAIADAQATLDTNETDLAKASIKAPVDGVVLTRSVEPGYAVAASLQAVELLTVATDLRELELQIDIDEADVGQVKLGQKVSFTVASYPNQKFSAELKKVAYSSTTSTDNVITYTGYLAVKNPELVLRPGMTATATIETASRKDVLTVPNTALRFTPRTTGTGSKGFNLNMGPNRSNGDRKAKEVQLNQSERMQTVYVLRDGQPQRVRVKTGLTDGRATEVIDGQIKAGDKVITEQLRAKTK